MEAAVTKEIRQKYKPAEPRTSARIESLGIFVYSLQVASADFFDNNISDGTKNIWVLSFQGGSESFVFTQDDDRVITEEELFAAMRLGSLSPLEKREPFKNSKELVESLSDQLLKGNPL